MPYEFLEEVATADIAFKAWGKDLGETFVAAADATMNIMLEELESLELRETRPLMLENESLEMLLFDFLQELIYYKDAEKLLLRVRDVEIIQRDSLSILQATSSGEEINPDRHRLRVDVKAVTLHQFKLEETVKGWEAFVILDI